MKKLIIILLILLCVTGIMAQEYNPNVTFIDSGDILAPSVEMNKFIIYLDANNVVQIKYGEGVTMSEAAKLFFEYIKQVK